MNTVLQHSHVIAILGLVLAFAFSGDAFAQNAHFVNASASLSGPSLVVTFKEAGLGNTPVTVTEQASATATATYECFNGGGKHPKATNKTSVNGQVSASGPFTSGKNGSISGSLTLTAPGPGSFSCPSGQTLVLASVSYTGVTVTDLTFGDSISIPGTFSAK